MTRALAASLAVLAACALTSRSEPRELRSFAPELASPASFVGPTCARIRIGRIVAASSLRLAIQRRVSPVELQAYETLRWTEPPDSYARRALVRALFARPLEQVVTGPALVLDVEVVAFEEVVDSTSRAGRVALRYELRNTQHVVARGEAAIVRPASATAIDAVVAAIGNALTAASEQLADQVVAAACSETPSSPRR
jgi:ABC-type uncharacterized transport system auxiliary subunit